MEDPNMDHSSWSRYKYTSKPPTVPSRTAAEQNTYNLLWHISKMSLEFWLSNIFTWNDDFQKMAVQEKMAVQDNSSNLYAFEILLRTSLVLHSLWKIHGSCQWWWGHQVKYYHCHQFKYHIHHYWIHQEPPIWQYGLDRNVEHHNNWQNRQISREKAQNVPKIGTKMHFWACIFVHCTLLVPKSKEVPKNGEVLKYFGLLSCMLHICILSIDDVWCCSMTQFFRNTQFWLSLIGCWHVLNMLLTFGMSSIFPTKQRDIQGISWHLFWKDKTKHIANTATYQTHLIWLSMCIFHHFIHIPPTTSAP